ncbi:hypothetical protein [Sinorhizobium mexicanum]|uniref:Uncharacterized protein n=1 Tax=Sinorhizobium mexicanum TaxID=375549 RepID=A0A859QQH6_9HYPH|nr:hypothetical protein [Sinorhizobium mexicanum]MBP1888116.1 hypothetical protein [Sinorhizobium mexicanum]QLL65655.1 hypothetical protein FKV68_30635 [Sinorhizobium mexicanum]
MQTSTVVVKSDITLSKVTLLQQLEAVVPAGLTHCLNAIAAQLAGGVVTCNDLVTGEAPALSSGMVALTEGASAPVKFTRRG